MQIAHDDDVAGRNLDRRPRLFAIIGRFTAGNCSFVSLIYSLIHALIYALMHSLFHAVASFLACLAVVEFAIGMRPRFSAFYAARSCTSAAVERRAQWAQQKNCPATSTPWPITRHWQCSQMGAIAWMAHSKLSNVCRAPAASTKKALS